MPDANQNLRRGDACVAPNRAQQGKQKKGEAMRGTPKNALRFWGPAPTDRDTFVRAGFNPAPAWTFPRVVVVMAHRRQFGA